MLILDAFHELSQRLCHLCPEFRLSFKRLIETIEFGNKLVEIPELSGIDFSRIDLFVLDKEHNTECWV